MRIWFVMMLLVSSLAVTAQSNVSKTGDKDLEKLVNKVEGRQKDKKPIFAMNYTPENDLEKEVVAAVEKYWKSMIDEDIVTSYAMMSDVYRKAVSFSDYAKQNRITLKHVEVNNIQFKGECARATGWMKGNTNTPMGTIKLAMKLFISKEGDEWHVYKNPYEVGGMTLPKGRNIKPPCTFPRPQHRTN